MARHLALIATTTNPFVINRLHLLQMNGNIRYWHSRYSEVVHSLHNTGPIPSDIESLSRNISLNEEHHRPITSENPNRLRPSSRNPEPKDDDERLLDDGCDADADILPILPRAFQRSKKHRYVATTWLLLALHFLRLIYDFVSWSSRERT